MILDRTQHLERMRRRLQRWRERLDRTLLCLEAEVDATGSHLPAALGTALSRLEAARARVEELTHSLAEVDQDEYVRSARALREAWVQLRSTEREFAARRARWQRRNHQTEQPSEPTAGGERLREELRAQHHLMGALRRFAAATEDRSASAAGSRLLKDLGRRARALQQRRSPA